MKQIGVWVVLAIWAFLSLDGIGFALSEGYTGRAFAATATVLSLLLLSMLLFAARGVADKVADAFGAGSGLFLGVFLFSLYVVYLFGTGTFAFRRIAIMAAFVFLPLALAMTQKTSVPGSWQDFLTIISVWAFVKFGPSRYLWSYPDNRLAYVFTVMVSVNLAIAVFLLSRRTKGVGYSIGWAKGWTPYVLGSFFLFCCVAIPIGMSVHFIAFAPQWAAWASLLGRSLGILIFTAWPEELLFRGLLQNLLTRSSKSELAGWWTSSVLFGLSHITNGHYPNWRYVLLATIAGLFYAWTWRKTNSIFASATAHAGVDISWHFLFRTF
ncbi:MAG: type II CAAX endopeptidase family protein [Candidatus Acidiferrum sp.]